MDTPGRRPFDGDEPMDVIERLAAADPLPEAERLTPEQEREAEALLARLLATAAAPERRAPRRRRRLLAAAAAGCAAALALAAAWVLDAGSSRIVEQAVAAVTREDSVYHVVQRRHVTGDVVTSAGRTFVIESWHASDGRMHEKSYAAVGGRRGRLLEDAAGMRPGEVLRYDATRNLLQGGGIFLDPMAADLPFIDPLGDPGEALRRLQERGLLHEAGETEVGGRDAHRLVSEPISEDGREQRFEYLVDSETHLPLVLRWSERAGEQEYGLVTEFLRYDRLPLNARSRALLDLDPHPDARCAQGADQARGVPDLGFPNPCRKG
jgi:hypothetical protein